jgi:hypothetical protein
MRSSWVVAILVLVISGSALAGPLATAGTYGSSSTMFDNGGALKGHVDWAVFNPGTFPYTGGYTPTAGEMVYAYQIFVTGTAPVSSFELLLTDAADNIGSFSDLGGQAPQSAVLTSMVSAKWTFAGIPQTDMSYGLVFSSPKTPYDLFATVVDTGQTAWVIPLPSPSSNPVPEPATLGLVAMGCVMLGLRRRGK